jgi:hypothetical protein
MNGQAYQDTSIAAAAAIGSEVVGVQDRSAAMLRLLGQDHTEELVDRAMLRAGAWLHGTLDWQGYWRLSGFIILALLIAAVNVQQGQQTIGMTRDSSGDIFGLLNWAFPHLASSVAGDEQAVARVVFASTLPSLLRTAMWLLFFSGPSTAVGMIKDKAQGLAQMKRCLEHHRGTLRFLLQCCAVSACVLPYWSQPSNPSTYQLLKNFTSGDLMALHLVLALLMARYSRETN